MGDCVIRNGQLMIDRKPFYLLGGEIHYWRLPVHEWADRLVWARKGGLNTVSVYIPWFWHEPEEGKTDFTGKTEKNRDLKFFLDTAAELGLKIIARPGPFINSELRFGGFPEWLFREYPDTLSHRADGRAVTGRPIPAEGEPAYRALVRRWYSDITAFLSGYDAGRGGPVILFQPDNEISAAWSYGLLNSLYDPNTIGQLWPDWLRNTYLTLENLNEKYGKNFQGFSDVAPPRGFPSSQYEKRLCIDWLNFKRRFFADWGACLAGWAKEGGITVPFVFNEPIAGFYGHGDHAGFGRVLREYGVEGMTACHIYSDRILDIEAMAAKSLGVELVKSSPWGSPPMAVEINTDWYISRLSRSEINLEPLLRAGFARGLQGTVMYPYTAQISSCEDTIEGPEYYVPGFIDRDGRPTWKYQAYQRYCDFVTAWQEEITETALAGDVTIAYTPGQRLLDFLGAAPLREGRTETGNPGGETFDAEPVLDTSGGSPGHDWLDGYEGVSKQTVTAESGLWKKTKEVTVLATRLNLGYELLDLVNPNRAPGERTLIIPCTGSLESEAIEYLLQHLDQGGSCIFFPTIPFYDVYGNADHRLAKKLGIRLCELIRPAGGESLDYGMRVITDGSGTEICAGGWIFRHAFPEGSRVLARYKGEPVVSVFPVGSGKAAIAGLDMEFRSAGSLNLWEGIFDAVNIRPGVRSEENYYHALLRKGVRGSILTVMNITGRYGPSRLTLRKPDEPEKTIRFNVELNPHEARCLMIGVKLGNARLVYTSSEIIPLNTKKNRLAIHGQAGTAGEMAFEHPVEVMLDGEALPSKCAGGYNIISYTHRKTPMIIEMGGSVD